MSLTMSHTEAIEARNALGARIREMADEFENNGQQWKDATTEANWNKINADYNEAVSFLDKVELARQTAERKAREAFGQSSDRVLFEDTRGQKIYGLKGNQKLVEPSRYDRYDAGEQLNFGDFLFWQVTGQQPEAMAKADYRNVASSPDSAGGFALDSILSRMVIEEVRANSVAIRAGAITVPMDSAELKIARMLTGPTPGWVAEAGTIPTSDATFDLVTLTPKKLAVLVPVTIEWLEDAQNGPRLLQDAVSRSLAEELDRVVWFGSGSGAEPQGVFGATGVGSISVAATPTDYSEITEGIGDVMEANCPLTASEMAMIAHPREWKTYQSLTDTTGQPLRAPDWASQIQRLSTTALPAGAAHHAIIGDMSQILLGMRYSQVRVEILREGSTASHDALQEYKVFVRAAIRADVAIAQPSWLTTLDNLTA